MPLNMVSSLVRPAMSIVHRLVVEPAGWVVVVALTAITAATLFRDGFANGAEQ